MVSNINLTREIAIRLIKEQEVMCPKCGKEKLCSRYTYKKQNVEYVCPECNEVYYPAKFF